MNHLGQHKLIQVAAQHIQAGGVVAYPTESCFGLGCDPENTKAIEKILSIKRRSKDQGFILVADDIDQVKHYIQWHILSPEQQKHVQSNWPAAISFVLPASAACSPLLRGKHTSLAVRIPDSYVVRALCLEADTALISSSANHSGQAALTTANQVKAILGDEIDYVLDLPTLGHAKPSRIIDALSLDVLRS